MSQAHLSISYDGEALRGGVMDVRDLAPALLAVGQLFDAANSVLNRDETAIKVQVRATGSGSFHIDIQVVQTVVHHVTSFFSGEGVTSAINLKELIFGFGVYKGVIWLIKKLKGKKPDRIERLSDNTVKIIFNGEEFEVPLPTIRLYQELSVRIAVEKMIVEPLKRDGIDKFDASDENGNRIEVFKQEVEVYERPDLPDEKIIEDSRRSAFSIISLAFKEDNKWRLSDGSSQISALIEDRAFLDRVETNQVAFAKGDILICDVKITQSQTTGGLKTEYVIEKVVEHRPAIRQLRLFDDEAERGGGEQTRRRANS